MWLLSFIPDFVVHVLTLLSFMAVLASLMFSNLIPLNIKFPLQVIGILVLALGLYLEGGIANESEWRAKVEAQKTEIAELKQKQAETTVQVVTKYVDRVKIVKEKADVIVREVPKYITEIDNSRCVLPDSVRLLHDAAAQGQGLPHTTTDTNEKTSGSEKARAK